MRKKFAIACSFFCLGLTGCVGQNSNLHVQGQPFMTTTINVPSGMYESFKADLSLGEDGKSIPISARFSMAEPSPQHKWLPTITYCVSGKDYHPLSCIRFSKEPHADALFVQEFFDKEENQLELESSNKVTGLPLHTTFVSLSVEGNEVTYKVNDKHVFKRDIGVKPKIFSYSCSSAICEMALYYNESAQ